MIIVISVTHNFKAFLKHRHSQFHSNVLRYVMVTSFYVVNFETCFKMTKIIQKLEIVFDLLVFNIRFSKNLFMSVFVYDNAPT